MEPKYTPELLRKPTSILPQRFADLKSEIVVADNKELKERLVESWNRLLVRLKEAHEEIKRDGSNVRVWDFILYPYPF